MAQFVPSSSTTPVVTSQLLNQPASLRSPTTVSSSSSTPIVVPSSSAAPGSCCEGGRPIVADPLTGQLVCSCQLENPSAASSLFCGLNRAAAAAAGLASVGSVGVAGLGPAMGFYGAYAAAATAAPNSDAAFLPAALTGEQAYYGAQGIDLKEMTPSWPYPASMYYPYDGALAAAAAAGYPFNGYGMDINGARRKNATRETTATLKAWLSEHKKNPYPTKGEKIMLAIITKMTLTQVSTWFANARRRLKKENKMTWEPKNRQEEDDTGDDDDLISNKDMAVGAEERSERLLHGDASRLDRKSPAPGDGEGDDDEELELLDSDSCPSPPPTNLAASSGARSEVKPLYRGPEPDGWPRPRLQAPTSPSSSLRTDSVTSSNDGHGGVTEIPLVKPRIWSLADMASGSRSQHNNNNNDPATALSTDNFLFHHPHHHHQQSNGGLLHNTRSFLMANGLPVTAAEGAAAAAAAAAATAAAPGKMYNPLPRLPIDTAPYPRPYFRFSGLDSRLLGNYRFPAHDLYPHFNASIVNTNSSQSMADSLALLAAKVSTAARPSWGSTTGPLVVACEGKERLESDMKPGG